MDVKNLSIVIKAVDLASADIEAVRAQLAALGDSSLKAAEKTDAASAANKRFGVSTKALGFAALGIGAIAAATAVAAVKMAGDYQASVVRLATSAGESQSNLKAVSDGMLQIARSTGTGTAELATAMYTIESGGQHGAAGLKVLQAAAQGAKTEGADLKTVADAVTSVLQDYHLKASAAGDVTSKLVAAVGAGKTTFQELAGSLHSVLPIASSAHIALSDITGALASMTVHGMSADQASQNLADTIKHMLAPTQVQTKELGQLGLSSSELAGMLGKKGITGTLQELTELITKHMGPAGKVMLNAFNQSKDAANDANVMISKMPPSVAKIAKAFQGGKLSLGEFRQDMKALPTDQANLLTQFAALQNRTSGFNDLLKSGSPAAQTYQDALRRVTGDATGLNVALMLTGENTAYVNEAVKTVSKATTEAGGNVKGWSEIQGTFNYKLSQLKEIAQTGAIALGQVLLPAATKLLGWVVDFLNWLPALFAGIGKIADAAKKTGAALAKGIGDGINSARRFLEGMLAATIKWGNDFIKFWAGIWRAIRTPVEVVSTILGVLFAPALAITGVKAAIAGAQITVHFIQAMIKAGIEAVIAGTKITIQFVQAMIKAGTEAIINGAKITISFIGAIVQTGVKVITTSAIMVGQGVAAAAVYAASGWAVAAAWIAANLPIVLIGLAILALIAIIVLIVTHWKTVMHWGATAWDTIRNAWSGAVGWFGGIWNGIVKGAESVGGAISRAIGGAFAGVVGIVKWYINTYIGAADLVIRGINSISSKANLPKIPEIPHLQSGTSYFQGGMALVGEQGPETVLLPKGSQVVSAQQTTQMMGGGETHYHLNVNVGTYAGQPGEINQLAITLWQAMARVARQHGKAESWPTIGVLPS